MFYQTQSILQLISMSESLALLCILWLYTLSFAIFTLFLHIIIINHSIIIIHAVLHIILCSSKYCIAGNLACIHGRDFLN